MTKKESESRGKLETHRDCLWCFETIRNMKMCEYGCAVNVLTKLFGGSYGRRGIKIKDGSAK